MMRHERWGWLSLLVLVACILLGWLWQQEEPVRTSDPIEKVIRSRRSGNSAGIGIASLLGDKFEGPPPLNLTVTIVDDGYQLAGSGGILAADATADEPDGPTIPLIEQRLSCDERPAPYAANEEERACDADGKRSFRVYDHVALTQRLGKIKDAFPNERRIIIAAIAPTPGEEVLAVLDLCRRSENPSRVLFDQAVLSPGLL